MAKRRTQAELALEAQAQVAKEEARLKLEVLRNKRKAARMRRAAAMSVHRAAEQNRFTRDWRAPATSADSEIVADLPRLNARARQVVRDDAWGKSIVRAFKRNVIGTGITMSCDGQPFAEDWKSWSEDPQRVDIEGKRDLIAIQQWAIGELVVVGEAFVVRWIMGSGANRYLKLQCFEYEQLDRYKIQEESTKNEVRNGIEIDENGKAVAYHFYRDHPHDIRGLSRPAPILMDTIRIPASMVTHFYDPERVRQSHGISRLAPVLRRLRDLAEYDAAQLRVARAEASIGLLIKGNDDEGDPLELDGLNVAYLNEDEEVTQFTPQRPGNTYDPFVRTQLKAIAAGVGISYSQIARDFDSGTFGSKRQENIEDRREFNPLIRLGTNGLCRPVFSDWYFIWASVNYEKSGDYFLGGPEPRLPWMGQGFEWVDPEQQGKGIERQMRLGLTSRTEQANLLGRSLQEIDREIQSDGTLDFLTEQESDGRENPSPDSATPTESETEAVDA